MKILIVAKTDSIHTARWISQIDNQGWDIHVYPSVLGGILHNQLSKQVVVHDDFLKFDKKVKIKPSSLPKIILALPDLMRCSWNYQKFHSLRLKKLITRLKPDIIHSLEFQSSAYLVSEVKEEFKTDFPKWIATNWGSDIYYFGRFPEHEKKIKAVLGKCDFYSCECQRDIKLAKNFGLKGKTLPVFPNAGGFDLKEIAKYRQPGPASERKLIMLKGYQGWSGRALVGLKALENCADLLSNYTIKVYSIADSNSEVPKVIEKIKQKACLNIEIVPNKTPHSEILKLHGRARTSIGLSISDGISTSLLEALIMGSFPIQSSTACTDEWINDGITGMAVPPEDIKAIEKALRKTLTDDKLIDQAMSQNYKIAEERLNYEFIKQKTIEFYETVEEQVNY